MVISPSFRRLTATIFLSLVLPLPSSAQTQVMQTYVATLPPSPEKLAQTLTASSDDLTMSNQNGVVMLAYAGGAVPSKLADILIDALPELGKDAFQSSQSTNFSIALIPSGSGSQIRLMMFQPQSESPSIKLPAGSEILINDGHGADCAGQIVASYPRDADAAVLAYSEWLVAEGYNVIDSSNASTSFFIGNKTGCSVFVYIQPDPEAQQRSTVVVRYLED